MNKYFVHAKEMYTPEWPAPIYANNKVEARKIAKDYLEKEGYTKEEIKGINIILEKAPISVTVLDMIARVSKFTDIKIMSWEGETIYRGKPYKCPTSYNCFGVWYYVIENDTIVYHTDYTKKYYPW